MVLLGRQFQIDSAIVLSIRCSCNHDPNPKNQASLLS